MPLSCCGFLGAVWDWVKGGVGFPLGGSQCEHVGALGFGVLTSYPAQHSEAEICSSVFTHSLAPQ